MTPIQQLVNADTDKIKHDGLRKAVESLVRDYNKDSDQAQFEMTEQSNIEKLHALVKKHAPEALVSKGKDRKESPRNTPPPPSSSDTLEDDTPKRGKATGTSKAIDDAVENFNRILEKYKAERGGEGAIPAIILRIIDELDNAKGGPTEAEQREAVIILVGTLRELDEENKRKNERAPDEEWWQEIGKGMTVLILAFVQHPLDGDLPMEGLHWAKEDVQKVIGDLNEARAYLKGHDETIVDTVKAGLAGAILEFREHYFWAMVMEEVDSISEFKDDVTDPEVGSLLEQAREDLLMICNDARLESNVEARIAAPQAIEELGAIQTMNAHDDMLVGKVQQMISDRMQIEVYWEFVNRLLDDLDPFMGELKAASPGQTRILIRATLLKLVASLDRPVPRSEIPAPPEPTPQQKAFDQLDRLRDELNDL